jgi:hypothetical protein
MLPNELQHQQLVKVVIEKRSRDRIELPIVVVRASGQVDNHGAAILFNGTPLMLAIRCWYPPGLRLTIAPVNLRSWP